MDKNKGDHNQTRRGLMDGNLVSTVYYNFGEVADWQNQPPAQRCLAEGNEPHVCGRRRHHCPGGNQGSFRPDSSTRLKRTITNTRAHDNAGRNVRLVAAARLYEQRIDHTRAVDRTRQLA